MKNRIIGVLLCALMLCTFAFAGCGQKPSSPFQTDETTAVASDQTTEIDSENTFADIPDTKETSQNEETEVGFAYGTGTEADPYVIMTAEQLKYFANQVNIQNTFKGQYIMLGSDIVLNDTSDWEAWGSTNENGTIIAPANLWEPIGTFVRLPYTISSEEDFDKALTEFGVSELYYYSSKSKNAYSTERFMREIFYYKSEFCGIFDGNNHTIKGLYVNDTVEYRGLFGNANNAVIRNVGIEESYINGSLYAGSIIGMGSECTISDCYNTGTVIVEDYGGGIAGYLIGGTVKNCDNTGTVCSKMGGGIVGYIDSGKVSLCHNGGSIGDATIGGIVGKNHNGIITYCYNSGDINGYNYVGGISGITNGSTNEIVNISCCYNIGPVNAEKSSCGGITGMAENCTISDCYNTGAIGGKCPAGGIAGAASRCAAFINCYNCGVISATGGYVEALVGTIDARDINYSSSCYFHSAYIPREKNKFGTSLSEDQMKHAESYVGFDFERIWELGAANEYTYPTLRWPEN